MSQQNPHTDRTTTPRATFQQTIKDEHLHSICFESRAFVHEKKRIFRKYFQADILQIRKKQLSLPRKKGD